jgi:hypothetical protein
VEPRLRVFENRVRREVLGHERIAVTGELRRLHIGELHDLYCSPNFRVINSRRMNWAGHVALTVGWRSSARVLGGNLRERDNLEVLGIDGKKILKFYVQELGRSRCR